MIIHGSIIRVIGEDTRNSDYISCKSRVYVRPMKSGLSCFFQVSCSTQRQLGQRSESFGISVVIHYVYEPLYRPNCRFLFQLLIKLGLEIQQLSGRALEVLQPESRPYAGSEPLIDNPNFNNTRNQELSQTHMSP